MLIRIVRSKPNKHKSEAFPTLNGLKQRGVLSPLATLFVIKMAQENCKEMELNETHQLLLYADHIKLLEKI
jgi:hypothetical protein